MFLASLKQRFAGVAARKVQLHGLVLVVRRHARQGRTPNALPSQTAVFGLCHLYEQPMLGVDYLATPWPDLLALRHSADHCSRCQQHGLHRLDLPVLSRRFPDLATQLFES